jgi:type I restriction enzyme S subunit
MQQLFPAEGEREPKRRFKAFSGEWEKKEVHNVFAILAGGDVPKNELSDKKTQEYNIPILSNGIDEKSLYGWTNKAKIYKPSLTVSARGTIGWTSLQENPFFPIVRLIVLTPKIEINLIYAYYYMKNIENDYKYAKVGIPQLTKPMIKNIKLVSPKNPKEQQKIASCLSSLDALIKAQNKKVEALKKHKTGLMQQMFVSGEV